MGDSNRGVSEAKHAGDGNYWEGKKLHFNYRYFLLSIFLDYKTNQCPSAVSFTSFGRYLEEDMDLEVKLKSTEEAQSKDVLACVINGEETIAEDTEALCNAMKELHVVGNKVRLYLWER